MNESQFSPERFRNQVVVVTGAASGMGRSVALRLASEGAVVLAVDRNAGALMPLAQSSGGIGKLVPCVADLADVDSIPSMFERAVAPFGRLDALVNAAGVVQIKDFLKITAEDWNRVLDINLRAVFFCIQAAAPYMLSARSGAILNFSSVSGRSGRPYSPHYAASKMALISLTRSAALAFAPHIRVNAICPGVVDTPMWDQIEVERGALFGLAPGEARRQVLQSVPLGRSASPEELAAVVAFLLSTEARYITGQSINVDGGLEMD